MTVTLRSHFTWAMPYQPGTTSRAGKPCCSGSGAPFMATATSTSSRRLLEAEPPRVVLLHAALEPVVDPGEPTSTARPVGAARPRRSRSGTPVHSAVPTAPFSQGWLTGRGDTPTRPLPAHSRVTRTVWGGIVEVGQAQRQRLLDLAVHASGQVAARPPGCRSGEHVVQAGRSDLLAEQLQRHRVVAAGEPQLVDPDALAVAGDPARGADLVQRDACPPPAADMLPVYSRVRRRQPPVRGARARDPDPGTGFRASDIGGRLEACSSRSLSASACGPPPHAPTSRHHGRSFCCSCTTGTEPEDRDDDRPGLPRLRHHPA